MTRRPRETPWFLLALAIAAATPACTDDAGVPVPCAATHTLRVGEGVTCVGPPPEPVCSSDACVEGAFCTAVERVRDDAELQAALAAPRPGLCIVPLPGRYDEPVTLRDGMSLLGRFHEDVALASVTIIGDGVTLRGVTVGAGGVQVDGARGARITRVLVKDSLSEAIKLTSGASAVLDQVEILGAANNGVFALDATSLIMRRGRVSGVPNSPPSAGVWAECSAGCDCVSPPEITIESSLIQGNTLVGVGLKGVSAVLHDVQISDQQVALTGVAAGGLFAGACASVGGTALSIVDNAGYGVLIDDASGVLGGPLPGDGIVISGNTIGFWAQKIASSKPGELRLQYATLTGNKGVGVGAAEQAKKVIVYCTHIEDTELKTLPVRVDGLPGGQEDVGDGVSWQGGSEVALEFVKVSNSGRASVLLDGPVAPGSLLKDVALLDGDDALGIQQQSLPANGEQPKIEGFVPPIQTSTIELYSVPEEPDSL